MNKIQTILTIQAAENDVQVIQYSGRGMYGKACLAITGDEQACMVAIAGLFNAMLDEITDADYEDHENLCIELHETHVTILTEMNRDSMGHGVVLYWPSLEYEIPTDTEEQES